MTAAHVIADQGCFLLSTTGQNVEHMGAQDVVFHEKADVAILPIKEVGDLEWFSLWSAALGYGHPHLGAGVEAYGYPMVGTETPVPGRLMKGHIQCHLTRKTDRYEYDAYELSFPAFHNLSGAPVYRPRFPNRVIGVVTESTTYSSQQGNDHTSACWSLAAATWSLWPWVKEVTGFDTSSS